MLLIKICWC